jgi:flagellar hook protein FlgE
MNAYSKGLDIISNNVANLSTPGFKLSVPAFSDVRLNGGSAGSGNGAGVEAGSARLSFRNGEPRESTNPLDAAIDGEGFFVLERDGERVFTRSGQFEFDDEGFLVERTTQARVLTSNEELQGVPFNIEALRTLPQQQTTEVFLSGTLARVNATTHELPNIEVFDSAGGTNVLRARFFRDSANPLFWTVEVFDAQNQPRGTGQIRFNENGTPAVDFNSVTVTVRPKDLPEFQVVFRLGDPGSFAGVTSTSSSTFSQLQVQRQDGFAFGSLDESTFDSDGKLTLTYSNGQTRKPATLLLARFNTTDGLRALSGGLFTAGEDLPPHYDVAKSSGLGSIIGRSLELSNVELTEQFTDLIIIQRGYQASSQMASTANEMLQQLLAIGQQR